MNPWSFITEGGPFMYVLLACSCIAFALIIERWLMLTFNFAVRKSFFNRIKTMVKDGNIQEAYHKCLTTSHPLSKVVAAVLYNYKNGVDAIESASDIEIQKVLPGIQARTNYINMVGNIATLLGLLGTISGLIASFSSLAGADPAKKAEMLGAGISTAMNTTAFGLIVAIPCIVFFTFLSTKEEKILKKYDEIVSEITHLVVYAGKNNGKGSPSGEFKEFRNYGS
jgi:biopolymer transport protein ExbB/TolQ